MVIYLLIGAGVTFVCSESEEIEPDELYSQNKKMFKVLNIFFWPYELGSAISRASLYYGGKLATQKFFRDQPAPEITIPAIMKQLAEIRSILESLDKKSGLP
jgi:hypothetical protein